ncbi:hypothetical protein PhCBS80983_g04210 [Powellomyces hirtus]|uniref:Uncharacterized protein n=1 Tax=Powellomyces hirtus TaxID=109895 RepID=A0A507E1G9_9FUNG|nr:hypothetical protein PhCBS80983_g04210 [Powellomyces hirtus]
MWSLPILMGSLTLSSTWNFHPAHCVLHTRWPYSTKVSMVSSKLVNSGMMTAIVSVLLNLALRLVPANLASTRSWRMDILSSLLYMWTISSWLPPALSLTSSQIPSQSLHLI